MGGVQRINFACCSAKDLVSDKLEIGTTVYRSAAAEEMLRLLKSRPRPTVLDFGPLLRENVEMLSGLHCKMFIEDYHQGLSDDPFAGISEGSLDAVLCWDMLNYLRRDAGHLLVQAIKPYMRPGGVILVQIASSQYVSKYPLRFRLIDRQHMSCEVESSETVVREPFTSRAIHTMLEGFKPMHSLHLRNGLQEHLFSFLR